MSDPSPLDAVTAFYQTHPISEKQILDKLAAQGVSPDSVTQDILQAHDQDHYGGTDANDKLAQRAGLSAETEVLDVCCGLGGPSRYYAHHVGCHVTGIDLTVSRIEGARRLSEMCGLGDKVTFLAGNALDMPFPDAGFDVALSQEAFCHIPDKPRLLVEIARVLKPGGRLAFTDILSTPLTTPDALVRLAAEMTFRDLASADNYRAMLADAGFDVLSVDDLGAEWRDILIDRLAMYRSLKDQTIDRFGPAHFQKWDSAYDFFVSRYATGALGGGRFLARRI
ncbi:class I SAM-dependent methyltransferase [Antarctobacter sp.]|uniref:class I SAM-dependent methyltransferase n=1 Tax=Antarctobacter sp. TaxID=1872577 RepID=UPI002B270D33|nr:methyltransferase domain-containing protein [Antarctobacter sp.]